MESGERKFIALLILIALVLRLFFVLYPWGTPLISDMKEYDELARGLLENGAYGPAMRPPLYPFFLAALYRISGSSLVAVRLVQAVLGSCVCLFVYGVALRLGGPRAARVSSLLVACYPSLIVYTNLVMSETLFIFLLAAAIWLLARDGEGRKADCMLAGIALGLACLTRSVLAGFVPVAAVWLWARREKRGAALLLLGALLFISPWTARNYLHYHRLVPIDTYGGFNFLIGNNPDATGRQNLDVLDKLGATYWKDWKGDAHRAVVGYREGIKFILRQPRDFLMIGVKKVGYLYGMEIRELSWGYSKGYFGAVPRPALIPVAIALIAAFPVLCLLALWGCCFRASGPRRVRGGWSLLILLILYFTAAHFITFGESRFHLPLVPVLAVFAGRLAMRGEGWGALRDRWLRLFLFVALFSLLCVNWGLHLRENRERLSAVLGPGGSRAELNY